MSFLTAVVLTPSSLLYSVLEVHGVGFWRVRYGMLELHISCFTVTLLYISCVTYQHNDRIVACVEGMIFYAFRHVDEGVIQHKQFYSNSNVVHAGIYTTDQQ